MERKDWLALTDEQLRIALYKAQGWKYDSGTRTWWHDEHGDGPPGLPKIKRDIPNSI